MKKNMLITFISYVVISLICLLTGAPIYKYNWDNCGTFASSNVLLTYSIYVLAVLQYILILSLYYIAGRRFLKLLSSLKSSFLSVWYLSIFFVIVNIVALLCFGENHSEYVYGIALLVYPLFMPVVSIPINVAIVGLFVAAVLPSLFLWLGMISKMKKAGHTVNIKKILIIISSLLLAIIISFVAITHTTLFRTYMIGRDFSINLPEQSQMVSYERRLGGESSVSFTIPASDLQDFIKSINNAGYTELLDTDQISLTYGIISKWNLDENDIYGYYQNMKSENILGELIITLTVTMDLIIMNSNEGYVTIYMQTF